MLQFRFSTVLKELLQTNLKRPLTGSRHKTWLPIHYCFGTTSFDARSVSKLKVLHAGVHRPLLCSSRAYCTKTEGAVQLDEPVKKDASGDGPAGDK